MREWQASDGGGVPEGPQSSWLETVLRVDVWSSASQKGTAQRLNLPFFSPPFTHQL